MGTIALVLALAAATPEAAASPEAAAPVPFEGEVVMSNRIRGMEVEMRFLIQGMKMRVEMADMKDPITLVDMEKREALSLDVARRTYRVSTLPAPRVLKEAKGLAEKTGKARVIAGHTCEEWLARDGREVFRIWTLAGTAYSPHPWMGTPTGGLAVFDFLRARNLFPLRLVQENRNGEARISWEAVRLERKALSPALFGLPKGYQLAR